MIDQEKKKKSEGAKVGRCKHRPRKNQQNVESIFEIDKLSRGGVKGNELCWHSTKQWTSC